MKNKATSKSLIEFCQIMQVAMQDSVPLPQALNAYADSNENQEAKSLANAIAKDLKEGKTVSQATQRLNELDPVLSKLLPFVLEKKLTTVLERYIQFLIVLESLTERARALAFYPFVISIMLLISLLHLNFHMFPQFLSFFTAEGIEPNLMFKLLYFAKLSYWPFSLILPSIIMVFVVLSFAFVFKSAHTFQGFYNRLYRASTALQRQEISRVQNIIALFLRAGQTLETSVALASQFTSAIHAQELRNVLSNLERGNGVDFAFTFSSILTHVVAENLTNEELAARLERAARQNNKISAFCLGILNKLIGIVLLLVIALLVASIASGTFGVFQWVIWSL
jgi:type II secretory pathway component PulF